MPVKETEARVRELNVTDFQADPSKEKGVLMEQQEVYNEEMGVETVGFVENRYGDRHLAIGRRRQPSKEFQ
jgi:hypothetical protein